MPDDLTPVIAACTRWLLAAYPPPAGVLSATLAEAQARQAATLAAELRYPTELDVHLLHLVAPSGSSSLDRLTGHESLSDSAADGWRTWVDETVVSWAACLLADPALARLAHRTLTETGRAGTVGAPHRLTDPGARDIEAAALLRHPDLLESITALHRATLTGLLASDGAAAA